MQSAAKLLSGLTPLWLFGGGFAVTRSFWTRATPKIRAD